MKVILATLLQEVTLELWPSSDRPIQPRRRGFTLGPAQPVQLRLR
jgi:hypothetical protein